MTGMIEELSLEGWEFVMGNSAACDLPTVNAQSIGSSLIFDAAAVCDHDIRLFIIHCARCLRIGLDARDQGLLPGTYPAAGAKQMVCQAMLIGWALMWKY